MTAPDAGRPDRDADPRRWTQLALLSLSVLLSLSAWLTATALGPQLQARWSLGAGQVGWLTSVVQLGFVAGTAAAALTNLADIIPLRRYFAVSAVLAASANLLLLAVTGYGGALAARFLTGFFLAGVYPPSMKMVSTWFRSSRGLAIGTVVGALTLGKASPYLLRVVGSPDGSTVIVGATLAGLVAAALVGVGYRDGPFEFPRRAFEWRRLARVVRHRPTMLATGGYLGHMWELYAMWTLIALFFTDYFGMRGAAPARGMTLAAIVAFLVIGAGGLGAVFAGRWADRFGRERATIAAMAVSGACALSIGWLTFAPPWLVVGLALVWGFTIVADSAQFSAIVTERAPADAVGTALMFQTMLGFALTGVSIQLASRMAAAVGWGPAFAVLGLGPAAGIVAMSRLQPRTPSGGISPAIEVQMSRTNDETR